MWHCFIYGESPLDFITSDINDILALISDCIFSGDLFEIKLLSDPDPDFYYLEA